MGNVMRYMKPKTGFDIMGKVMSYMKRKTGFDITEKEFTFRMLTLVMTPLYKQFIEKDIKDYETFQLGVLDLFNQVNKAAMPGMHYDSPKYDSEKLKQCFEAWKEASAEEEMMKTVKEFILNNVDLNKPDQPEVVIGAVAPAGAIVVKRTVKIVPQLRFVRFIPDVIFVPSFTFLAIMGTKISRIRLMKKVPSKTFDDDA